MKNNKLASKLEIAQAIRPWHPALSQVMTMAARDVELVSGRWGVLHKPERATLFHVIIRQGMKALCELAPKFLTLIEEPEGSALDYVVVDMDPVKIGLRWGINNDNYVRRNRTVRTSEIQEQGAFPWHMEDSGGVVTATMAYSLGDDYIERGTSSWWLHRLVIGQERKSRLDFIEEVAVWEKPVREIPKPLSDPQIIAWNDGMTILEQITKEIRRKLA